MVDFIGQYYNWFKALHVIAIIAWMAGMLYLPRLFVYHAQAENGSDSSEMLKVMEHKLLRIIMNPAMIIAWLSAGLLIWANPSLFEGGWMHVKFLCVFLMSGLHGVFSKWRKVFAADQNTKSHVFYRWWNEAPTVLMIIIVIMAVAEPF